MPANKDFKRLVRSRMTKTGEAYTTARAHLLRQTQKLPARSPGGADYARLAGMTDAKIKEKTGCTWDRWVRALDRAGAQAWPHRDIAKYVREKYQTPGWWSQTVTVGYERIKGLRAIGQRRGGGFEVNKTKTFPVPLTRLYRAWSVARERARWLPGIPLAVRGSTRNKSMRVTWPDQTSVVVFFESKGRSKSVVALAHGKLPDDAAAARMRTFWTERLAELAGALSQPRG